MRTRHAAISLAALSTGLTAAVALHRRAERRLPATAAPAIPVSVPSVPATDGVVLPFVRPVAPAPVPEQPAAPARCGDAGGRTKAGSPCAAKATTAGRCHHHRVAA
jgi:hypothetical protein